MLSETIRVAINAQIHTRFSAGGVNTVLAGLIKALSSLDGEDKYVIVGTSENREWLEQFLGENQELVIKPVKEIAPLNGKRNLLRRVLAPIARPILRKACQEFVPPQPKPVNLWPAAPLPDGFWESLGCDVVHFPYQEHVACALPTVYNPHDLQHLHFPQYFSPKDIAWRETIYLTGCHFASTIVVASEWTKQDFIKQYAIQPEKIQVIPWAPPTQAYGVPNTEEIASVKKRYRLDKPFALFPAMIWEHKNHLTLIEAYLKARRETDLGLQIICTGFQNEPHWSRIKKRLEKNDLCEDVRFVGLISESDLRCIYNQALFVIVPTLFEAASGPVFEAWHEGIPVACSDVTSLPEQVADAALLFNPHSVDDIKNVLVRMTIDTDLRDELVAKGQRRLKDFSWEKTAKAYRAVYRRAAGHELTEEDRKLLGWDWMRHSADRLA